MSLTKKQKEALERFDKSGLNKVTPTTVTSVTSTTSGTLHPAGECKGNLVLEPIGEGNYLYLYGDKKGVSKVFKEKKDYFIDIEGQKFRFKEKTPENLFFRVPKKTTIEKWLNGEYKTKDINTIFDGLVNFYKVNFDLTYQIDAVILSLRDIMTWLRDYMNAFYFIGIDATKGAGKTSLLEVMSLFSKHGCMSGDISAPFLARSIEKQKLCLHIDELDQNSSDKKNELEGILRKAQRKGNSYRRINPNTLEPEKFEVHNAHAFSFRTTIEDALKNRCLPTRMKVSSDKTLPVILYHKEITTYPLFEDLFFHFFENISSYASSQVTEVTPIPEGGNQDSVTKKRLELFNFFTKDFTPEEIDLMENLVGRNIELCYICLNVIHLLGLDAFKEIKQVLLNKQQDEDIPESFYLEKLKEYLKKLFDKTDGWRLTKGEHEGCFYYPKTKTFGGFVKFLKDDEIPPIGSSKFNGLLKDLGFIEGLNWRNQKNEKGKPVRCLIYDSEISKSLDMGIENATQTL